jgi:hypothetical protein
MKIVMGPVMLAPPDWGLNEGDMVILTPDGEDGRPEVLAAQILYGTAFAGGRVVMLLPGRREEDQTWQVMTVMLSDGTAKSAAQAMGSLSIQVYACKAGWGRTAQADLVFAPGLTGLEMRRLSEQTRAPILTVGGEYRSSKRPEIIRVGNEALLFESKKGNYEIPVVYDPNGPIYRPASWAAQHSVACEV